MEGKGEGGREQKIKSKLFDNQSKGIIHVSERGFKALA